MPVRNIFGKGSEWPKGEGPHQHIVVSSRVRLARNLAGSPFPGWGKKAERALTLEKILPHVEALPEMVDAYSFACQDLSALEKQVLVERHLISREHAAKGLGSAVVMNKRQTLSIMINEEDHLRMQSIRSGLDLRVAYAALDRVDEELDGLVKFAFHSRFGYLTACPTNLGTGMRASAMLHLPGLVLSEQVNQVIAAVNKIGLAVRGLYGEGTEALANLFQISNQHTLGEREPEIIARLERVIEQIINHERNARRKLVEDQPHKVLDHVGRAYAALRYAHILESKEALTQLSMLRLGSDLGILPSDLGRTIDTLLVEIQPAHLQINSQRKLGPEERDVLRAETLRQRLAGVPEPRPESLQPPVDPEPPVI
jgi:protein arginine kinase